MLLRNLCDFPGLAAGATIAANANAAEWENAWDFVNNAPTKKFTNAWQGNACMHANLSAATLEYVGWNQANSLAPAGTIWECWAGQMLFTGTARSPDTRIRSIQFVGTGGGQVLGISQSTAGVLQVRNTSSGATTAGSVALALNKWYLIEVHLLITNHATGAFTTDLICTDPVTGQVVDTIMGVTNTSAGLSSGFGAVWFGCMNTVSVTFSAGWDIDVCYFHTEPSVGFLGLYPPAYVGIPMNP